MNGLNYCQENTDSQRPLVETEHIAVKTEFMELQTLLFHIKN